MLHNEARKLLVEGYEATHNAEAIAKIFHVNKYTVFFSVATQLIAYGYSIHRKVESCNATFVFLPAISI